MGPKNSLLATLGALAVGTTVLVPSAAEAKYHQQCEVIRKLTNVDELLAVVRRPRDPCAAVALQRIIDLSDVAAGPGGFNQVADAS